MKALFTFVFAAFLYAGCEKAYKYPEPSLIGLWVAEGYQYSITDTVGGGRHIQFWSFQKDNKHYLRMKFDTLRTTYQIKGLTPNLLALQDSADTSAPIIRMQRSSSKLVP